MQNNTTEVSILDGARYLLHGIIKMASGIVALGGIACIIGWIYANSYFSTIGAPWIKNELSFIIFVGYSWKPIFAVIFFSYIGITILADKENIEKSLEIKILRSITSIGLWIFLLLLPSDMLIGIYLSPSIAIIISFILLVISIVLSISTIILMSLNFGSNIEIPTLYAVTGYYLIIILALYTVPRQMGKNFALIDKDLQGSSLPYVMLRNNNKTFYRLLIVSNKLYYIFPGNYKGNFPPISIVMPSEIESIQKINKKFSNNNRM